MGRAPCCQKLGIKKGPWTPEEDQILTSFIHQHGHPNWRALPKQAGLLRCGKSCRLRWINYLRPDIKRGNFTKEEEDTIIQLHEIMGNRWSAIAARLPGRTDNEIKNIWHTHLKKRLEKYQNKKAECRKDKSRPKHSKNNFTETNTADNLSTSPGQSYSSDDFSSNSEVSSVELPDSTMNWVNGEDMLGIHQFDFPIIDEKFWSSEDFSADANDMRNDMPSELQFSDNSTVSEIYDSLIQQSDGDMDFWLDVFVNADGEPELPEF